jgi:AraC-like DNA-binding protein
MVNRVTDTSNYRYIPLNDFITISNIVTIHYFEFAKDYVFSGEKHNFWEFLYVDKGEVEILAEDVGYKLNQGDIVFHKPNEFHSVWANRKIAPNILIVSFVCNSKDISFFNNKILNLTTADIELLGKIYAEGKNTFSTNLNSTYPFLEKKVTPDSFASEQLIKIYLELFLINLIRGSNSNENNKRISKTVKQKMESNIVDEIIGYMNENIYKDFSFDDICSYFYIGKTHLKTMFKSKINKGVMCYFQNLKIEEAKKLIREGKYNFTEISELLNYDSVHYFSRCFKKTTNMTPSEYAVSIKSR